MPVALTKSNDGYVGPQGEFYQGHPTVEELKDNARYIQGKSDNGSRKRAWVF